MKIIKYFIQFLIILILFTIFKILGLKFSSYLSSKIVSTIGPIFRSKDLIRANILLQKILKKEEGQGLDEETISDLDYDVSKTTANMILQVA